MTGCDIIPLANKACSGKCKDGVCPSSPRIWVLAACGGMIALLEKGPQSKLAPLSHGESVVFASLEEFQHTMNTSTFDQLVIVGSKGDVAWVHASLPPTATPRIAAEIEYPLLPAWFKQPLPMGQLTHALENLFST